MRDDTCGIIFSTLQSSVQDLDFIFEYKELKEMLVVLHVIV